MSVDDAFGPTLMARLITALGELNGSRSVVATPKTWLANSPDEPLLLAIPARSPREVATLVQAVPSASVVAISENSLDHAVYRDYLSAGAVSVLSADGSPAQLRAGLDASINGFSVLPRPVAASVANRLADPPPTLELSEQDVRLLNLMAGGSSATSTARTLGYSPRHLRRLTAGLLQRLGAENQAHAVALAVRWGLVRVSDPGQS